MISKNLIQSYAIGGATALVYYCEPINTQDIDVFVFTHTPNTPLINLSPLYEFLKNRGFEFHKEYVVISNIPVQFLVPYNDLLVEAVNHAVWVKFDGSKVRILSLEYLIAIMVQTARMKDKARLEYIFTENVSFNHAKLQKIIKKFGLTNQWKKITREIKL